MSTDFEKRRLRKMLNRASYSRGKGKTQNRSRKKRLTRHASKPQGGWEK